MLKITKVSILYLFLTSITYAQPITENSLSGQWTGTTTAPSTGNELQIRVNLLENKSTWTYFTPITGPRNPCFDREFPITIKGLAENKFSFNVDGTSTLNGCPKFTLIVERVDEKTLNGTFIDGRKAILKRK